MTLIQPGSVSETNDRQESVSNPVRIVGIGASAGGLDGLKNFFQNMSTESGLAFVVIQHLSPDHKSLMNEILARYTTMEIHIARDGMVIESDSVYLIPPRKSLTVRSGSLWLSDPHPDEIHFPIDHFYHSLAIDQGAQAIAVILSGTGSDGSRGIATVKRAGGIVFAQNEESAKFEGMPRSAIETGHVDYVLPPERIAQKLKLPSSLIPSASAVGTIGALPDPRTEEAIARILEKVRAHTCIDFSYYKRNSLLRRIEKRMAITGSADIQAYSEWLDENPDEISALRQDLLIHVTHFFRDPEAFVIIKEKVLPQLIMQKLNGKGNPELRIWTAGCSTGEEAYTLAMLVIEELEKQKLACLFTVRIFATDVDKQSIDYANHGVYPLSIENSVDKHYLTRFFVRQGDTYQVTKELRRVVVFAPHNLTKDPPFSNLDLISCRNMLIYLQSDMQLKVLSLFHFALSSSGFLFLGPSETIGKLSHMFEPYNSKWNVFRHKASRKSVSAPPLPVDRSSGGVTVLDGRERRRFSISAEHAENRKNSELYSTFVNEHMPPSLLLDENLDVRHLTGKIQPYLSPAEGRPSWNIHKMMEPGLAISIVTAANKIRAGEKRVRFRNRLVQTPSGEEVVDVLVKPFSSSGKAYNEYMLVTFEPVREEEENQLSQADLDENVRRQMLWLEQQLRDTEERLQAAIEELETSNEELQSTNEELIAANEELQSTNEELQAVNEELVTINAEYQFKIQELTELNNDMDLFLVSTKIGTIFLDTQFCVRRFTPAVTKEINLLDVDIGRPFSHISHNFLYNDFIKDAAQVLKLLRSLEKEIKSKTGKWYKMRMMPYRTLEHFTKGIIITFVDITELKEMNEELLRLSNAMEQSPVMVAITDLEGRIVFVNSTFLQMVGCSAESMYGKPLEGLNDWQASGVRYAEILDKLRRGDSWEGELAGIGCNGQTYWEQAKLLPILKRGETIHYMKISENITERKETEELLRKSEMLSAVGQLAAGIAHEIRNPLTALKGFTKLMQEDNKRNYISIMAMELERIEQIVSELLVLSKPQAMDFLPTALDAVLRDVVMLIEAQAIMNDVQLELTVPEEYLYVHGVANQLKQVFINLLKNGIEAMPGGGTITIKVSKDEGGMIWTTVQDQGIGIPPEKLAKLGEPFFSTKSKGTGLGLVMSYKIIENHHGKLVYESEPGKGTKVSVGLPSLPQLHH
ncbi:chemotaxis protein CheB [Paenibacillus beijingensis]|uniref:Histidine kinase n=1 Tax=Paenibacillus beijingensis TaxID=1126833 RepID=A0A0D5NH41_9BACL|nr:chemotaxis protein CheB [Paenibacillus beijingensis]AJY74455.1 histidine kinase [Paenibacillus beijingensis]